MYSLGELCLIMKKEEKRKEWRNFTFDLFGTKWYVKFVDFIPKEEDEPLDGTVHWGKCNDNDNTITIAFGTPNGYKFPDDKIQRTLLHEIVHAMCGTGNYSITNDEPFVEWMAGCLFNLYHQNTFNNVFK